MIEPESITGAAGAYVLLIRLPVALTPEIPGRAGAVLAPGRYIYCGSAWGPGGLRARIARHLRAGKPVRWHVDRLTEIGAVEEVAVRVGGQECDLVAAFTAGGATVALPGFGSSDCRRCPAHLLAAPPGFEARALSATTRAAGRLGPGRTAPL